MRSRKSGQVRQSLRALSQGREHRRTWWRLHIRLSQMGSAAASLRRHRKPRRTSRGRRRHEGRVAPGQGDSIPLFLTNVHNDSSKTRRSIRIDEYQAIDPNTRTIDILYRLLTDEPEAPPSLWQSRNLWLPCAYAWRLCALPTATWSM
jgi:hypothetical protein